VTTISEIARAADVSVESVLHVLNRDNSVSSEVAARVVEVMDAYGYRPQRPDGEPAERGPEGGVAGDAAEETRLQRHERGVEAEDAFGDADDELLQAVNHAAGEPETAGAKRLRHEALEGRPLAERMTVIDGLLERLAKDLDGIKDELGQARSERLDDLTLLVDLLTTSWRTVDHRLRAIERKLEQVEPSPEQLSSSS
jgi:hypothetical protein